MSTTPTDLGAASADANAPQLSLQSVYLKDCSYEAPNGPRVQGEWNPQINLDLHTGVNPLTTDVREVVLTVTVSASTRRKAGQRRSGYALIITRDDKSLQMNDAG